MHEPASNFAQLDDPEFLAERRRLREKLLLLPDGHPDRASLAALYEAMTEEFTRRARSAWQQV